MCHAIESTATENRWHAAHGSDSDSEFPSHIEMRPLWPGQISQIGTLFASVGDHYGPDHGPDHGPDGYEETKRPTTAVASLSDGTTCPQ